MKQLLYLILCITVAQYATAASTIVDNATAFKTALSAPSAGDTIWVKDGTYTGTFALSGNGTETNPIVVLAVNPGKAILVNASGSILAIYGAYLEVHGFVFKPNNASTLVEFRKSGSATLAAYHSRVSNCVFDGANIPLGNAGKWFFFYGQHNRVDHCLFVNRKTDAGVTLCVQLSGDGTGTGGGHEDHLNNYHRIDHNYFGYRPLSSADNEAETIRVGYSGTSKSPSRTIIEDNIFYKCNGEVECISIKSGNNTVRRNLFQEIEATLCLRHGDSATVETNVFMGKSGVPAGGIRIVNRGHKIYNNYFQDLEGEKYNSALSFMRGAVGASNSGYEAVDGVELTHNTFINCKSILFGLTGSEPQSTWPKNTVLANNIFHNTSSTDVYQTFSTGSSDSPKMSGTTFSNNVVSTKNGNFNESGLTETILDLHSINEVMLLDGCTPPLVGAGSFPYVLNDITGNEREDGKDIGAFQVDNLNKPLNVPQLTDLHNGVGTSYTYTINLQ